ncbi:DUF4231 domain-containing protein [Kitasatospora griseola]|uniref:DUF4231 domain-containing protein n=1 Tax=Kitasatospora griseola TaxID=2064 RepID=UPI0036DE3EA1
MQLQHRIHAAQINRRIVLLTFSSAPTLFLALLIGNVAAWGRIDLMRVNIACIPIFIALLISMVPVYYNIVEDKEWESDEIATLELELELAVERKRLGVAGLALPSQTKRHLYLEAVPSLIEQYRVEQKHYRRIHNLLQSVLIIGSLATSTLAALGDSIPGNRWATVGVSFSVGIAAGFTGYFKFRERSFHLQQTADSIEEELVAVELKISRYKSIANDGDALADFTDRVESMKNEQRKRQQQLDQPTEAPAS